MTKARPDALGFVREFWWNGCARLQRVASSFVPVFRKRFAFVPVLFRFRFAWRKVGKPVFLNAEHADIAEYTESGVKRKGRQEPLVRIEVQRKGAMTPRRKAKISPGNFFILNKPEQS